MPRFFPFRLVLALLTAGLLCVGPGTIQAGDSQAPTRASGRSGPGRLLKAKGSAWIWFVDSFGTRHRISSPEIQRKWWSGGPRVEDVTVSGLEKFRAGEDIDFATNPYAFVVSGDAQVLRTRLSTDPLGDSLRDVLGGRLFSSPPSTASPSPPDPSAQPAVEASPAAALTRPTLAQITVTSEPTGASLFRVGTGKRLGKTPRTLKLSPGPLAISVVLKGHKKARRQLSLKAGQVETLHIDLEAQPDPVESPRPSPRPAPEASVAPPPVTQAQTSAEPPTASPAPGPTLVAATFSETVSLSVPGVQTVPGVPSSGVESMELGFLGVSPARLDVKRADAGLAWAALPSPAGDRLASLADLDPDEEGPSTSVRILDLRRAGATHWKVVGLPSGSGPLAPTAWLSDRDLLLSDAGDQTRLLLDADAGTVRKPKRGALARSTDAQSRTWLPRGEMERRPETLELLCTRDIPGKPDLVAGLGLSTDGRLVAGALRSSPRRPALISMITGVVVPLPDSGVDLSAADFSWMLGDHLLIRVPDGRATVLRLSARTDPSPQVSPAAAMAVATGDPTTSVAAVQGTTPPAPSPAPSLAEALPPTVVTTAMLPDPSAILKEGGSLRPPRPPASGSSSGVVATPSPDPAPTVSQAPVALLSSPSPSPVPLPSTVPPMDPPPTPSPSTTQESPVPSPSVMSLVVTTLALPSPGPNIDAAAVPDPSPSIPSLAAVAATTATSGSMATDRTRVTSLTLALNPGTHWSYSLGTATLDRSVTGLVTLEAGPGIVVHDRFESHPGEPSSAFRALVVGSTGLVEAARGRTADGLFTAPQAAIEVLRWPLAPGAEWVGATTRGQVSGPVSVTAPAGVFPDALVVDVITRHSDPLDITTRTLTHRMHVDGAAGLLRLQLLRPAGHTRPIMELTSFEAGPTPTTTGPGPMLIVGSASDGDEEEREAFGETPSPSAGAPGAGPSPGQDAESEEEALLRAKADEHLTQARQLLAGRFPLQARSAVESALAFDPANPGYAAVKRQVLAALVKQASHVPGVFLLGSTEADLITRFGIPDRIDPEAGHLEVSPSHTVDYDRILIYRGSPHGSPPVDGESESSDGSRDQEAGSQQMALWRVYLRKARVVARRIDSKGDFAKANFPRVDQRLETHLLKRLPVQGKGALANTRWLHWDLGTVQVRCQTLALPKRVFDPDRGYVYQPPRGPGEHLLTSALVYLDPETAELSLADR